MKHIKTGFIIFFLSLGITLPLTAEDCHNHNHNHVHAKEKSEHHHASAPTPALPKEKIKQRAKNILQLFIHKGNLDASWKNGKLIKTEKIAFKGKEEWRLVFLNDKAKDAKEKKLYIFFTLTGRYIVANFTGK